MFSPAADRNKTPIFNVLGPRLSGATRLLEIACGSLQHACFMAPQLPHIAWLPTDIDAATIEFGRSMSIARPTLQHPCFSTCMTRRGRSAMWTRSTRPTCYTSRPRVRWTPCSAALEACSIGPARFICTVLSSGKVHTRHQATRHSTRIFEQETLRGASVLWKMWHTQPRRRGLHTLAISTCPRTTRCSCLLARMDRELTEQRDRVHLSDHPACRVVAPFTLHGRERHLQFQLSHVVASTEVHREISSAYGKRRVINNADDVCPPHPTGCGKAPVLEGTADVHQGGEGDHECKGVRGRLQEQCRQREKH